MPEELGRVEKPSVEEFRKGRKLFFVPLVFIGKEPPAEFLEKFNRYWNQVENQISELELKLGKVCRIYHEMIAAGGDEGVKLLESLHEKSYRIVENRLNKGGVFEALEDEELLTQIMDCQRCISIGLQSRSVFSMIYDSYTEASKKRNEYIAQQVEKTLGENEIGLIMMSEGHHAQFSPNIQLFYVAPPALDEINRWLRDRQSAPPEDKKAEEQESAGEEKPAAENPESR